MVGADDDAVVGKPREQRFEHPVAPFDACDLPPSRFLAIDWHAGGAVLLSEGSRNSHVAMLARARGVPMIVGLGIDPCRLAGEALVDAMGGDHGPAVTIPASGSQVGTWPRLFGRGIASIRATASATAGS